MTDPKLAIGVLLFVLGMVPVAAGQEWTQWRGPGRDGFVLTPRHVVFLTNGADSIVVKRNAPAFAVERRYEVAESSTWSMPVLLGSNILVRDATGLMLLTGAK